VLVAAWALLFLPQLMGQGFVAGDSTAYDAFANFSAARWVSAHERTFWNPYIFLGLPTVQSLADPRPQWLPDVLLTLWDRMTRGPTGWPLGPVLLVHLCGMLCVSVLALRLWRCRAAAATLAGMVWGYAPGIVVPLAFGHDAQSMAVSLIPATWLTADGVLTARHTRGALAHALGLSLAVALLLLVGHPQYACFGLVALAAFVLVRMSSAAVTGRASFVVAAIALGFTMSATVWWPTLLYLGETERADPLFATRHAAQFSLAGRDLWALGWPRAVGFSGSDYWGGQRATDYANSLGLIGLAFAAWGCLGGARRHQRLVIGLLVIAGAASLLALGPNLPWLGERILRVPFLSAFRTPSTWMVLAQLAGALIAAYGLERMLAFARQHERAMRLSALVTLALAGLLAIARPPIEQRWKEVADRTLERRQGELLAASRAAAAPPPAVAPEAAQRATGDLILHLAALGAVLGIASFARGPGHAVIVLAAVTALEPADLGSVVIPAARAAGGHEVEQATPALALVAAADPLHRVYPLDKDLLFSNGWVDWRARQVAGLATPPRRWMELRRQGVLLSDGFVRAAAVRYVGGHDLVLEDSSGYERVGPDVLSRRDALPRAYSVPRVEALESDAALIDAMRRTSFDPSRIAYVVDRRLAGSYPGSAAATVSWRRDDPDGLDLDVKAAAPAFLVVADAWFPGWTATLDGKPLPIARVNHVLRGIPVPAGSHRIAMRYRPLGWDASRALTWAGWKGWAAAALALWLAARRPPDWNRLRAYWPPKR